MNDLTWQTGCILAMVLIVGGLSCIAWWLNRLRKENLRIQLNPMLQRDYRVGRDAKDRS